MVILAVLAAIAGLARTVIGPFQESIRLNLQLSDLQIGVLQGPALAIPTAMAAIPIGLLIDRYPRKYALLGLAVADLIGNLASAWAGTFATLFLARCLVGVVAPATAIVAYSLIGDLFEPRRRGRAAMSYGIAQVLGASSAFALGGILLTAAHSGAGGWRWAMGWISAPLLVGLALAFFLREPVRGGVLGTDTSFAALVPKLTTRASMIATLLVGSAMVAIADVASLIWAAPILSRKFALPSDEIGAQMALVILFSGVVGPIAGGNVVDLAQRHGPRGAVRFLAALALFSAVAGFFPLLPSAVPMMLLLTVFLTLGCAVSVVVPTLITLVMPNEIRGICCSICISGGVIVGIGLAPLAVSSLALLFSGAVAIAAALCLICVVTSLCCAVSFAAGIKFFPSESVA